MTQFMTPDINNYTDLQSIQSLHYQEKTDPEKAKKAVSQQFESLLVQMLLKNMREANKSFASSDSDSESNGSEMYTDLFDKQISMNLSQSGLGLAKDIEGYLNRKSSVASTSPQEIKPLHIQDHINHKAVLPLHQAALIEKSEIPSFITPPVDHFGFDDTTDFVKTLWDSAKVAAKLIGTDPKILLAQAALETNWGRNIIPQEEGKSTHNLFNIKANHAWESKYVSHETLEEENGILVKEPAKFRTYDSYLDSFIDYAHFLKQNSRYSEALNNASNPQQFVQSLQKANYATDSAYSAKIMSIYSSHKFNDMCQNLT